MLIYKTLLDLPPPYLRYLLQSLSSTYNTRSASHILLKVSKAHISLGRSSFESAGASNWNDLQKTLKLYSFISISSFKGSIMDTYWQLWLLCVMYCCLYLLAFVPNNVCTMFCTATMLFCCHVVLLPCCFYVVLLPCYVLKCFCNVVLGLFLCSVVVSFLSWCVFCPIFLFLIPAPVPAGGLLVGRHCK